MKFIFPDGRESRPENFSGGLSSYLANAFTVPDGLSARLPMADEGFVPVWTAYLKEAAAKGVFAVLRSELPQLNFPVEKGISNNDDYLAVTRAEKPVSGIVPVPPCFVRSPEKIELAIHATPAGRIPVIVIRDREDFIYFLRALACRNEPAAVPPSMGACAVSGYNNVRRYAEYRERIQVEDPFGLVLPEERKSMYQDRFLLVSDGPYSGVGAREAGFGDDEWRRYSVNIRIGHESAHYFTKRCLGSMRNNAHDELIADFAGLREAFGRFDPALFLLLCGLDGGAPARENGRIRNYRGDPPLTDADFDDMCRLLELAAHNVAMFERNCGGSATKIDFTTSAIICMASAGFESIASTDGAGLLEEKFKTLCQ